MQWAWLSLLPVFFFAAEAAAQTLPVVNLSGTPLPISEGETIANRIVAVFANPPFSSPTTPVSYTVTGTATSGSDFTALSGTVSSWSGSIVSTDNIVISIIDDDIDEDTETVVITLTAGTGYTLDSNAANLSRTITITDNDTAGVTITESGTPQSTSVAENSGTDTYTVELDSEPTAAVTITPTSGTTLAATVAPATLTFTASTWDTAQTVTVTGVNDGTTGNRSFTITHAASSSDTKYNGISGINDVSVTVVDDDAPTAGVTIVQSGGSTSVTEASGAGRTDTYTVVLDTQPSHSVTITPTSGTATAATVSGALTFSTSNWNTAQTVTVTGVDDDIDQSANRTSTISHAASSSDSDYNNISIDPVTATVVDDDTAGVTITESGTPPSTSVTEASGAGRTDTYTVVLDTQPTANVTVTPSSGTATAATVSGALTFSTSNWNTAQTVTVTGVDDDIDQSANRTSTISHAASSTDTNYSGISIGNVTATVVDDDTAGVTIVQSGGSTSVTEASGAGRTDTYTVVLDSQPSHSVTITPTSTSTSAATVSGALTFSTTNWDTAQTVTVTGVNDNTTGNRSSTISHAASSSDSDYNNISIGNVTATVVDDDGSPTLPTVTITGGSAVTEGSNATFTVSRTGGTTAELTVLLRVSENENNGRDFVASSNEGDDTVTIPIGSGSVNYPVATVGDSTHEPNGEVRLFLRESDSAYSRNTSSVTASVTVNDDDAPSSPTTPAVSFASASMSVAENANPASFMVQVNLSPPPTSNFNLVYTTGGTAALGPDSATADAFTANTSPIAVVAGSSNVEIEFLVWNDTSPENDETIVLTLSNGTGYTVGSPSVHTVTITDDDGGSSDDDGGSSDDDGGGGGSMGLTFSPSALPVTEGGSSTYTVKLSSEPTGDVTVTIASDNGDVTVDTDSTRAGNQTTLSFTPSNWNQAQAVTVSAVQDADTSDDSAMLTHTASGGGYGSVSGTVNVNVKDVDGAAPPAVSTPPVVSITGSGPISEGDDAHFTLSATPPPGEGNPISVNVSISASGNVVAAGERGSRSVTIDASGTTSFTVSTQEDDIYEEDGRITATVAAGSGYRPHGSSGSAVVVVEDDDPGLDVSQPSLSVSEGRSTSYTMALATEPTGDVTVTVSISGGEGTGLTTAPSMGGLGRSLRQGGEGTGLTITPTRLVFTPSNWSEEQRVTVTAAENAATGRTITLSHSASGGGYDGIPLSDVEVRVVSANPAAAVGGWQLRFGRTVSQQVVDALRQRWSTNPTAGHLTVAGETISSTTPPPALAENEGLLSKALGFDPLTLQEVVEDSSFTIAPQPQPEIEAEGGAPQLALWGQGALSSFKGEGNGLSSLNGDVTTLLLGADWRTTRWQAGAALSHSWGTGSYEADGGADGDLSSSLTGLFPYSRYALTPRLAIWAVAGYGWGHLSLQPDGGDRDYKPTTTMGMAALGMDGLLLDGGKEGISLTSTAELLTLKSTTAEVEGLDASEGSVSRLRLGLEATRAFPLSNGASLLPTMAVGIRQDSGNAETGFGVDLGAGMVWNDPERGIRGEVRGRTLLTHREKSFQEQGMAISFSWDPTPSKRGPSLSLSHTMGATRSGGMDALLESTTMEDASPSSGGQQEFAAELAYGFPAHRDRLTLTPAVALALSSTSRNYSLLWSLAPYAGQMQTPPWEVALEGERLEQHSPTSAVHHSLKLTFSSLF